MRSVPRSSSPDNLSHFFLFVTRLTRLSTAHATTTDLVLRVEDHALCVAFHNLFRLAALVTALVVAAWIGAALDNLLTVLAPLCVMIVCECVCDLEA